MCVKEYMHNSIVCGVLYWDMDGLKKIWLLVPQTPYCNVEAGEQVKLKNENKNM